MTCPTPEGALRLARRARLTGAVLVALALATPATCLGKSAPAAWPDVRAPLTAEMLAGRDASVLARLRNEIYARRGRTFRTYELHRWFASQAWYKPSKRPSTAPLTPVEAKNLALILAAEAALAKKGAVDTPAGPRFHLDSAVNLFQYPPFTPAERSVLDAHGVVVMPTERTQLFHIYESNDYYGIPSFISVDTVLQIFHIFFDMTLRSVEERQLAPRLEALLDGLLAQSIAAHNATADPALKAAAARNAAFFAVPLRLLSTRKMRPPAVGADLTAQELALVAGKAAAASPLMGRTFDYTQFIPRGHYTRSETLKRYFQASMWLGQVGIALEDGPGKSGLLQSLLMVQHLRAQPKRGKSLGTLWQEIYQPTAFFVGLADDPGPDDLGAIVERVYGREVTLGALVAPDKRKQALDALVEVYHRKAKITGQGLAKQKPQLRFMGQRFVPDSEVFHQLTRANRARKEMRLFPNGLDFMAALGSDKAKALLLGEMKQTWSGWLGYPEALEAVIQAFGRTDEATWNRTLYYRWLYLLQALVDERAMARVGPPFVRSDGWKRKSLSTALGSWAELRHNTILYAKESMSAECGGDSGEVELWIPEPPKGYVEPNVVFFRRLGAVLAATDAQLSARRMLQPHLRGQLKRLRDVVTFLQRVAEKEVAGKPRTLAEYEQIQKLGSLFDNITLSLLSDGEPVQWSDFQGPDGHMPVIADVHTANGQALEVGVGRAHEMYVLVEIEGKLKLTRGAVFSYYEFPWPAADRLTDEKWQKLLEAGKQPAQPSWIAPVLAPERKGRPIEPIPSRAREALPESIEQFSTRPGWKKIAYETGC